MLRLRQDDRQIAIVILEEYQACDDRICFDPVTIPLSWTLNVKPFVTPESR
jgi:hypothetical protein